jgi:hypothetical protein
VGVSEGQVTDSPSLVTEVSAGRRLSASGWSGTAASGVSGVLGVSGVSGVSAVLGGALPGTESMATSARSSVEGADGGG